jgi:hypothetical protein
VTGEKLQDQKFDERFRRAARASAKFNSALRQIKDSPASKLGAAVMRGLDIEAFEKGQAQPAPNGVYPQNPESSPIFRQMVFWKYGITFRELVYEIDINKNADAHRRLMAVHRDYWRLLSGVEFKNLKLKFAVEHFAIITQGSDFGLDALTPGELAECLDEICPCHQRHSPEYLKKLRVRIGLAIRRLTAGNLR